MGRAEDGAGCGRLSHCSWSVSSKFENGLVRGSIFSPQVHSHTIITICAPYLVQLKLSLPWSTPAPPAQSDTIWKRFISMSSNDVVHKVLMLVVDGIGDVSLPALGERTPLETAHHPVMDAMAGVVVVSMWRCR
jgi:hypothetical protein